MENKKRLLKDLPFGNLEKGDVIYKGSRGFGGSYSITNGNLYYESGGASDRGLQGFNHAEEAILDTVWDNPEWFEVADLKHIDFIQKKGQIILRFEPIDKGDQEDLVKGLIHILPKLGEEKGWTWNKFKDITTSMKNN